MIIPVHSLSDEALENLIKEYCLRDWGLNETEFPLAARIEQVRQAVSQGRLVVLYSEHFETAQLVAADDARGLV
ncbi:MAG: hypothetical protein C9356_11530 [Oleiphilus sp.]|nr:MAG: hypothetical protein C9356_11530 [Oleiphilus sp.]